MVFPVVMYGCESWTRKQTECQRIDAFELWYWRRLLRVPWTATRSNQSILKKISPGCSLEGLMLKLKLQYFGHLVRRADSLEKTLMLGKIEGTTEEEMVGWHHQLDGHEFEQALGVGHGQGIQACCGPWGHKESDMTEPLNWTEKQKDAIFLRNPLYWNITTLWAFRWFWRWLACGCFGLQIFLCILGCLLHSLRFPLLGTCFEIEVGRIFLVLVYFSLL